MTKSNGITEKQLHQTLKDKVDSIGTLSTLETTEKTTVVGAVNELKGKTDKIGDLTTLTTTAKDSIVNAIKENTAQLAETTQEIGVKNTLPVWLQESLRTVSKQLDEHIRQSAINVKQPPYNAKGDGVSDDTQAIKDALSNGENIFIPKGTYLISDTISFQNKRIYGIEPNRTILKGIIADASKPILAVGRTSIVESMRIEYDETLITGSETKGTRVGIRTYGGENGWALQKGGTLRNLIFKNVGTAIWDGDKGAFSSSFRDIEILNFSKCGIDMTGSRTGNVYENIHVTNVSKPDLRPSNAIRIVNESECSLIQINIEHCTCDRPLELTNVRGFFATSIHLEGIDVKGNYNGYIYMQGSTGVFGTLTFYWTGAEKTGTSLFRLGYGTPTSNDPNDTTNLDSSYVKINVLHCKGLARKDLGVHPSYPDTRRTLGRVQPFYFFYRDSAETGEYIVDIDKYVYLTLTSTEDDRVYYDSFNSDPHNKITFYKKGDIRKTGTTAQRPTQRLCKGVSRYYDTSLHKSIIWDGTNWRDGSGAVV